MVFQTIIAWIKRDEEVLENLKKRVVALENHVLFLKREHVKESKELDAIFAAFPNIKRPARPLDDEKGKP